MKKGILQKVVEACEKGEYAQCLRMVNKILELDKSNYIALSYKGACLYQLNRIEEAIVVLTECIRIDTTDNYNYIFRGDCYSKLSQNEKASLDYLAAIKLNPLNSTFDRLGRVLFSMGEHERAIEIMKKVIRSKESAEPFLVLIFMLNLFRRSQEAFEVAEEGAQAFPGDGRFIRYFHNIYTIDESIITN